MPIMESPANSTETPENSSAQKAKVKKVPLTKAQKRKRLKQNLILLSVSTCIALIVGELTLRWIVFNGGENFKNLRNPSDYFYEWDANYWLLQHRIDSANQHPRVTHPYLGWSEDIDPVTYYHHDSKNIEKRRPVLLYGDSFSACIDSVQCFEDILNADTVFSKENYLINYGVGGYGVCQASLLCRKTAPHYQKPLVVFGLLTTDLDRTILPVRSGQKPYYDIDQEQLVLKGYPIDSNSNHFFDTHSISTTSLLLRRYMRSKLNIVPYRIKTWWDEKEKSIAHIQAVNGLLIKALANELRAKEIDFVFLVFHFEDDMMSPKSEDNWRDQFLKRTLAEAKIPYIWSKGIVREHRKLHPENIHDTYIVPGNGHPTTLYNRLISEEIKRIALEQARPDDFLPDTLNEELYAVRIRQREAAIRKNASLLELATAKAKENGVSLDRQIFLEAAYLMNLELYTERPFQPDGVFEGKWFTK
jgi:hypothetical protein